MSSAPFELVLETGEAVRVLAFSGRERVSRPFAFDIEVVAAEGLAYLERRASLLLRDGESLVRQVHGRLERVHTKRAVEGLAHARVRLAPRLARLGRRRARRVFQDKTTLDILEAILADWGLPHHFIVGRSLPKRPYSVQYDETDLGYVERLLAEDGLFYSFEHDLDASRGDVLLVADRVQELASIDGDPRLLYEPTAEGATGRCGDNVVTEVVRRERALPKGVRVRGYDHRRPRFAHEEAAGAASLETLDYDESSYEDDLPFARASPGSRRSERGRSRSTAPPTAAGSSRFASWCSKTRVDLPSSGVSSTRATAVSGCQTERRAIRTGPSSCRSRRFRVLACRRRGPDRRPSPRSSWAPRGARSTPTTSGESRCGSTGTVSRPTTTPRAAGSAC
jgi:uncharacterized protein involved in type VI secretion and phage assembly